MECRDIKELLSGYIDQVLDEKELILVKEHLLSCKNCSGDLEALKIALSRIKSVKDVLAPDDFLQKVHSRINEKSEFDRIISKFFTSPKIRIPIEAVGVLTTVVLVVAVFRFMHPGGRPSYYPQINEEMISQNLKPAEYPVPKDLFESKKSLTAIRLPETKTLQIAGTESIKPMLNKGTAVPTRIETQSFGSKGSSLESISLGSAREELYSRQTLSNSTFRGGVAKNETLGIDYKSMGGKEIAINKESIPDSKPEILLTIDSSKISLSDCVTKIRTIVESRLGTILSVEIDGSGVKNIISLKIPTIAYGRFMKELGQIGTIRVGGSPVKLQVKYLFLKVEIAVTQ